MMEKATHSEDQFLGINHFPFLSMLFRANYFLIRFMQTNYETKAIVEKLSLQLPP